jgi:hypothetical protein
MPGREFGEIDEEVLTERRTRRQLIRKDKRPSMREDGSRESRQETGPWRRGAQRSD